MPKRTGTKVTRPSKQSYSNLFIAYYSTIALFLIGWAIPETRVWGINWWAYQPSALQAILGVLAVGIAPLVWRLSRNIKDKTDVDAPPDTAGRYWGLVTITSLIFVGLYYILPATTHFLGDGYELIIRLAQGVGSSKSWDIGASLVNDLISNALGARSEANALQTFRVIAVGSGLLMLITAAFFSYKLFDRLMERGLFFLGLTGGGYALQFFGYVENYALFIVMVMAFTLLGLLAALGKASRWLAVIPALLAVTLHIFGVALLPALLYILLHDRWPVVQIGAMSRRSRVLFFGVTAAVSLAVYFYLFYNYYFFRFAFLPFVPDRFTVDDDYLLAPKHIGDLLNLLILLVPGIVVFVTEILTRRRRSLWSRTEGRFLILLLGSTLACIYLFNPGHGMPRNWDLFALPGIPLAVIVYYSLLSDQQSSRRRFLATALIIGLGFLGLIPRVSSQRIPDVAIMHFKNYVELDPTRNRNSRRLLTDYYRSVGDEAAANNWNSLAVRSFPEANLTNRGKQLLASGDMDQAEALFKRALEINPIFVDAYSNLGTCYINRGQLEEALEVLEIADGLNPLNAPVINNKGTVFLRSGDYEMAEKQFLEALRIDPAHIGAMAGLISVNVRRKDDQQTSKYLELVRPSSQLSVDFFKQGVDVCNEAGLSRSAKLAFAIAVERGASADWQQAAIAKYPALDQ